MFNFPPVIMRRCKVLRMPLCEHIQFSSRASQAGAAAGNQVQLSSSHDVPNESCELSSPVSTCPHNIHENTAAVARCCCCASTASSTARTVVQQACTSAHDCTFVLLSHGTEPKPDWSSQHAAGRKQCRPDQPGRALVSVLGCVHPVCSSKPCCLGS